jgi:hypothetical protein
MAINEKNNQIEITKGHLLSAQIDLDSAKRAASRAHSKLRRRRREAESGFFSIQYCSNIYLLVRQFLEGNTPLSLWRHTTPKNVQRKTLLME